MGSEQSTQQQESTPSSSTPSPRGTPKKRADLSNIRAELQSPPLKALPKSLAESLDAGVPQPSTTAAEDAKMSPEPPQPTATTTENDTDAILSPPLAASVAATSSSPPPEPCSPEQKPTGEVEQPIDEVEQREQASMLIQRMWNFYLLRMDALDEMDELRRRRTIHRLLARIETKAALRMQRRFRAHQQTKYDAACLLQAHGRGYTTRQHAAVWRLQKQAFEEAERRRQQEAEMLRQREFEARYAALMAKAPHRFALKIQSCVRQWIAVCAEEAAERAAAEAEAAVAAAAEAEAAEAAAAMEAKAGAKAAKATKATKAPTPRPTPRPRPNPDPDPDPDPRP